MRLWQIVILGLIVFVGLQCRTEDVLQIETGKGQYGVVSVRGSEKDWIIGPGYDGLEIVPGGKFFWVKRKGLWGVVDRKGEVAVEYSFDSFKSNGLDSSIYYAKWKNQYAVVSFGEMWCVTDTLYDSVWVVTTTKERFANYTFVMSRGKYGLVGPGCQELLSPIYDTVIWVGADNWPDPILYSYRGRCGMINAEGNQVALLGYDSISVCITESTREGARIAYLNDSVAFFNEKSEPFNRKINAQTLADYKDWRWNLSMIGCKVQRKHR